MDPKEVLRRALGQYQGDDLARARAAFRNCTPEQMQQEHGFSGQTRAQILAGYEQHAADCAAALRWLESAR